VDTNPTPSELQVRAETAGFAGFEITDADGPSNFNFLRNAEGDDLEEVVRLAHVGHSKLADTQYSGGYRPNSPMTAAKAGRFFIETEDDPSFGDTVHVRAKANGANDVLGIFSGTASPGLIPLNDFSFHKLFDEVAVVEIG